MKIIQRKIEQKVIANNGPECFANDSLLLTFYQKCTKNPFIRRTTAEITNTLKCTKCNTDIYPISWTEDIERVYDFYLKSTNPHKVSFTLTKLFYLILFFGIVLIILAVFVIYFPEKIKLLS
jgi:hypothetical protein